ncbi:uncharacterized protein A1O5_04491 [Cladophialophora psammophila CBS 110553]|uniref:AMP-dependent synthetase/ligase domain-containing protein n=1 Tax=Cladophialophora psammophila CBS 110553 TaxID=1182543 RepID=W9WVM5_9EURO|nr:uncharacterized protein A1O5_04491 [Cladophialophora psammophila CBS 110553]EXJ71988.1 hypothetical protein A1O5_04491 [Cladophialophora psammophila CBS 110553]
MPLLAQRKLAVPTQDLLSWIFDRPDYDPDKPIYIDTSNPSRTLCLNQGRSMVRKLAAGFRAAGLKKGECVCVHSFNDIYYSVLFLEILAAGAIFVGTNPSYTPFELKHHLMTAGAKFVITEPELLDAIKAVSGDCGISDSNVRIFNVKGQEVPKGFQTWSELLHHGERDWDRFDNEEICGATPAAFLFSSGTTGLPKAAVISHHNLIAQHTLAIVPDTAPWEVRRLLYMPMFHAAIVPVGHTTPFKAGHKTYVMRRFEMQEFLQSIQAFKITDLSISPPVVVMALASPLLNRYDLTSVKWCRSGSAPLGKVHQREFEKHLAPDGVFNQVWGMTETTCVASRFWYPENDSTGSIGRFIPNLDAKIVDEQDNDITAVGAKGELLVRGPTIIRGYYKNPAANREAFDEEGHFRTGDIVSCGRMLDDNTTIQADGRSVDETINETAATAKWYILDRKKELIKVRGFQVSPAELEKVLLQHPAIVDAAVIGVKVYHDATTSSPSSGSLVDSGKDGEHPRAYVVLGQGRSTTEEDVKAWCGQHLTKYKALTGGVRFIDALPRNAGGKLLKGVLREEAAKDVGFGGPPMQDIKSLDSMDEVSSTFRAKL